MLSCTKSTFEDLKFEGLLCLRRAQVENVYMFVYCFALLFICLFYLSFFFFFFSGLSECGLQDTPQHQILVFSFVFVFQHFIFYQYHSRLDFFLRKRIKRETQNIYNFCKENECKTKTKWKLFLLFWLWRVSQINVILSVLSFIFCECSLQQKR